MKETIDTSEPTSPCHKTNTDYHGVPNFMIPTQIEARSVTYSVLDASSIHQKAFTRGLTDTRISDIDIVLTGLKVKCLVGCFESNRGVYTKVSLEGIEARSWREILLLTLPGTEACLTTVIKMEKLSGSLIDIELEPIPSAKKSKDITIHMLVKGLLGKLDYNWTGLADSWGKIRLPDAAVKNRMSI
jgi:hypothetical protein